MLEDVLMEEAMEVGEDEVRLEHIYLLSYCHSSLQADTDKNSIIQTSELFKWTASSQFPITLNG